jgi:hypothetical protein
MTLAAAKILLQTVCAGDGLGVASAAGGNRAEMHESRLMGSVRRALVVVGAVIGVALPSAAAASAADQVELKSRLGSDLCLDAPFGVNTATMTGPCDGGWSHLLWVFNSAGQIESVGFPGNCLSISDSADNTTVTLSPCQANTDNQRWTHLASGQVASALGSCLNVKGGDASLTTPVIAYQCIADAADEQWDSVP